ncbi:hypothetical protein RchiOBHm_Chr4g0424701 [Rosa chinensis]|uniref:Uncharacterized protein n=1 Tax=Rosa chinensis TaxID=74649 RepID=A0A2P6QYX4_ROSCH|nr:hypothetical protein RchiOBHm_Chr4g0424701 [Rosa chinensis]
MVEERNSCYIHHREYEQLDQELTVMGIGCYSNHEVEEDVHNYCNLDIHYEQMVQEPQSWDYLKAYSDQNHWRTWRLGSSSEDNVTLCDRLAGIGKPDLYW